MTESAHYSWDFDRPSPTWLAQFSSFSAAIFQWLPKADKKGLKKSAAVARVVGYTAEPERVFEKANALCARLNRENAKAKTPPPWLQKQYSISRPAEMVVERKSQNLTPAEARTIRLRVMKKQLLPAGFIVGSDGAYVRGVGDQIHIVHFSVWCHRLRVTLGFHYSFISSGARSAHIALSRFALS